MPELAREEPLQDLALGVVGAGAVGAALVRGLCAAGASVRLWNRDPARAEALCRELEGARAQAVPRLDQVARGVDAVLFAVSEAALETVAEALDHALQASPSTDTPSTDAGPVASVALHTAGARGAEALAALTRRGWAGAQLHPLAAIPPGGSIPVGTWWGLSGAPLAHPLGARIVAGLGGHVLAVADGAAARYHLAANLVAGGAVALVDLGLAALADSADPEASRRALAALLASAARNLEHAPPALALTGPQVRGAVGVVAAHLETAEGLDPEVRAAYRLLARRMVALARARAGADASHLAELERLLAAT